MSKKKTVNLKILLLSLGMALSVCMLIGRLFFLQVVQNKKFSSISKRQYSKSLRIKKDRGVIYDRNLKILAASAKAGSVFINPREVENANKAINALSKNLHIKKSILRKKFKNKKNFLWIKRKTDPKIIENLRSLDLKGVGFIEEYKRFYPKRELASNILGFVGLDNKGLAGLEYEFNEYIDGKENIIVIEKDAKGRNISYAEKWLNKNKGSDIVTTIDEVIQYIAEKELKKQIRDFKAKGGVVVVMDPFTGDVLAMAVYPYFNPNSYNRYRNTSWTNRAVSHSYEPGSTFKSILISAALEEGIITPDDLFYCENGAAKIGGIVIHDTHQYKWMSVKNILSKSSNIGAAKIGQKLTKDSFYRYIKKFGFGRKTGIDLPGESAGIVAATKRWSGASLGSISIGHEIAVTPLQLVTAISALANGGILMKPRIVKSIQKNKTIIKDFPVIAVERVISADTGRKVTNMLKSVVTDGTGLLAAVEGYPVAGKTGTAQKIDPRTRTYSKDKFLASFVGYLPADDPKIAILVMIDEPAKNIYGGKVAAPVFSKIGKQVMQYMNVPPVSVES